MTKYTFTEQNKTKRRGHSFGNRARQIINPDDVGPGRYTLVREFDKKTSGTGYQGQGASFKFTGKYRPLGTEPAPGPGAYFKNGPPTDFDTLKKSKGSSLAGRTRLPGYSLDDTPAPNKYNVSDSYAASQLPGAKGMGRSAVLSSRPAITNGSIYDDGTPAPNKYNINSTLGDKNDRHGKYFSMGKKPVEIPNKDDIPGPGKYNPNIGGESEEKRKKKGNSFGLRLDSGSSVYVTSTLASKIILKDS